MSSVQVCTNSCKLSAGCTKRHPYQADAECNDGCKRRATHFFDRRLSLCRSCVKRRRVSDRVSDHRLDLSEHMGDDTAESEAQRCSDDEGGDDGDAESEAQRSSGDEGGGDGAAESEAQRSSDDEGGE